MTDSIAFGGLTHRNRYPVLGDNFNWTPLRDVGTLSLLLMPGAYNPNGGAGQGQWTDQSGFARHALPINNGPVQVPDDGAGNPVFDGATGWLDIIGASLADNVNYPAASMSSVDNGSMIVISRQTAPLPTEAGNYTTPATISGTGATPGLYQTSAGARCTGYDATDYVDAFASGGVFAAGQAHVQVGAWDAVGLYCACDSLTLGSVTPYNFGRVALSAGNIGANTWVGRSYNQYFTGTIYAVAVYPSKVSDETVSNWTKWARKVGLI